MRDILLLIALVIFICIGFPAMKRLDRFLNENLKSENEESDPDHQSGK